MRFAAPRMAAAVALVSIGLGGLCTLPAAQGRAAPTPEAAIERVRITEMRDGVRLWEVEADHAEVFEERGIAILTQVVHPVRIVIYHGEERLTSVARKAVVDLKTKDLELVGRVRSVSSGGTRILSEQMRWSAEKRHITTELPVVVEKAGFHTRGRGMVADTILERMTIHSRVTSEITLGGPQGPGR